MATNEEARAGSGDAAPVLSMDKHLMYFFLNKAIVDSRLRPQSCYHLANCIEMQEIVDCKLDANNE